MTSYIIIIIQNRQLLVESLQKSINEAKIQNGTIPVRFIKMLLTGSGAAGKTSFSNLLMKKRFNSKHHSTNVVQSKHAISVSCRKAALVGLNSTQDQGVTWLEMDDSSQMSYLKQVLLQTNRSDKDQREVLPTESPHVTTTKSTITAENQSDVSDHDSSIKKDYTNIAKSLRQSVNSLTSLIPSHSQWSQWSVKGIYDGVKQKSADLFGSSAVKSEKLTCFKSLVETQHTTKATIPTHHPGEELNIITILDTGGQPEYIHLLPTVNVHPMITFIVHDLSKSLDDQVSVEYSEHGKHTFKPYSLQYSNLDMIKFLMSSINDSLEKTASQIPRLVTVRGTDTSSYICCVGTHADKVDPELVNEIDSKLANMVEKLDCKASVWLNKSDGVLFSVDNTTAGKSGNAEDPTATLIRNEIESLSLRKDVYEVPITWMLLEFEIRQVCTEREKPYIAFQECVSIALQSNLISDVQQVKNALIYHHLLGVLLYYPEVPGLCDFIIIDHQWLFDKLSQIVCFTYKKSPANQQATNQLKYHGILSKELLQNLKWEDDLKQDYFIWLLVEMNIIAEVPRKIGAGADFFIPCVLPTYTSQPTGDDLLSKYGCLQGEPLLIQFISKLLPRGFFCCLVVKILQHLPNGWSQFTSQKDTCHTYSNLITFSLPHAYVLSLLDKLSYLEV